MNTINRAFRLLAVPVAVFLLAAPAALAQDNATDSNSSTSHRDEERQDVYLGTASESIFMGQDPVTGDNVIIVTPPVQEEQDNSWGNDTEINIQVTP